MPFEMSAKFASSQENNEAEFQLRGCYITYCHALRTHFFINTYKEFIFFLMNYVEDVMKPILIEVTSDADHDKPIEFLGIDRNPVLMTKEEPATTEKEATIRTMEIVEVDSPLTSSEYFCIKEEVQQREPEHISVDVSGASNSEEPSRETSVLQNTSDKHCNDKDTSAASENEIDSLDTRMKSEEFDSDMEIISEFNVSPIKSEPIYVIRPVVNDVISRVQTTLIRVGGGLPAQEKDLNFIIDTDTANESHTSPPSKPQTGETFHRTGSEVGLENENNSLGGAAHCGCNEQASQYNLLNADNDLEKTVLSDLQVSVPLSKSQHSEKSLGSTINNISKEPVSQSSPHQEDPSLESNVYKISKEPVSQSSPQHEESSLEATIHYVIKEPVSRVDCHAESYPLIASDSTEKSNSHSDSNKVLHLIEDNSNILMTQTDTDQRMLFEGNQKCSELVDVLESKLLEYGEDEDFEPPIILSNRGNNKTIVTPFDINKERTHSSQNDIAVDDTNLNVTDMTKCTENPLSEPDSGNVSLGQLEQLNDDTKDFQATYESKASTESNAVTQLQMDIGNVEPGCDLVKNNDVTGIMSEIETQTEDSKDVFGNLFMNIASYSANMSASDYVMESSHQEENEIIETKFQIRSLSVVVDRLRPPGKDTKFCVCEECGRLFRYKNHLIFHKGTHMKEKPFACQMCPRRYSARQALSQHVRHKHEQFSKRLVCDYPGCAYFAFTQRRLDRHKQSVHKIVVEHLSLFSCKYCDEKFVHKSTLGIHERVMHTGERPYVCQFCGKKFYDNSCLRRHLMRMHSNKHREQCPYCSKRFFGSCDMRRHIDMHTGTRPYACTLCDKAFVQKTHLTKHLRSMHNTTS